MDGQGLLHNRAAAIFHAEERLHRLMAILGHQFGDETLLTRALTHPSLAGHKNNQRLEFLGDAVLQLCISQELYARGGDREGKLTFKRQRLVCEEALANIARAIGLGGHLRMSGSLEADGGREQESILADAMEAVLAAVYLDGGLKAASDLVNRLWNDAISRADANLDPKSALQALLASRGVPEPEYRLLKEEGPPHGRMFTVAVLTDSREMAQGTGRTKKSAQQQAARKALQALQGPEADG